MTNIDRSVLTRFQPGQSGNPGGKAAGARNRISGRFLNDLADDYEQHGAAVIARVREESPVTYIKVVASLLPVVGLLAIVLGLRPRWWRGACHPAHREEPGWPRCA